MTTEPCGRCPGNVSPGFVVYRQGVRVCRECDRRDRDAQIPDAAAAAEKLNRGGREPARLDLPDK